MPKRNDCCFFTSILIFFVLLILMCVSIFHYTDYKQGISEEICNITSVSYPKQEEENNFYKCKCGKRCYSYVGICNKIFMNDVFIPKSYIKPYKLNSIDIQKNNICSSYANKNCITDFSKLYEIVTNNAQSMQLLVNNSMPCFKKNNVYFKENQTDDKYKNMIIFITLSGVSFIVVLFGFCLYKLH